MSDIVDKRVLTDALRTLAGYLDDLGRVRFDDATTKMRLVINYGQRDETARSLAGLFRAQISRERFLEHVMGEGGLTPPAGQLAQLAFAYDLILHIKMGWKLNLREILSRPELSGGGMDQRWKTFQQRFVLPLRDGVQAVRAEVERTAADRIEPNEAVQAAVAVLFGGAAPPAANPAVEPAAAASPAASAAPATPAPTVEVPERLQPLAAALAAAQVDDATRGDLAVDLELLTLELAKQAPAAVRLHELAEGFAAAGLEQPARACLGELLVSGGDDASAQEARSALAAEREALDRERAALVAERASIEAERAALAAQRTSLSAEREALTASQKAARPQ